MVAQVCRPLRRGPVVSLLTLLGALAIGCGGSQEEGAPVAGSFVGEVSKPVASVAIIAAEAGEGQGEREVRALIYGDREKGIVERFMGSAKGNAVELKSEGGAQFEGQLTADGATGTITLADRNKTKVPFKAAPATGVTGWYQVTLLANGKVRGAAGTGARLEGRLAKTQSKKDVYPINGTLTPPKGARRKFAVPFVFPGRPPEKALPADAAFIVSSDGTIRGGAKKGTNKGFTCLIID